MHYLSKPTIVLAFFCAALSSILTIRPAGAQPVDDSHLQDVASPQQVLERITGDDAFEVDARRLAVLRTLKDAIRDYKAAQGRQELTPAERELFLAHKEAEARIRAKYDRETHTDESRKYYHKFREAAFAHDKDPRDKMNIVMEFAPSLAQGLAHKWGVEARRYDEYHGKIKLKHDTNNRNAFALILIGLSFFLLLIAAGTDRRVGEGVKVEQQGEEIRIGYRRGKFSPLTALSFYPLFFNISLFLLTLSVGLIFIFLGSGDEGVAWLDKHVPLPSYVTPDFLVTSLINTVYVVLIAPWVLLTIANFARRGRGTISVGPQWITARGKTIALKECGEIYGVDNSGEGMVDETVEFPDGGNAASRAAASGRAYAVAIGNAWALIQGSLGKVRYQVCVDNNGSPFVLADKLPEGRARNICGILQKAVAKARGGNA